MKHSVIARMGYLVTAAMVLVAVPTHSQAALLTPPLGQIVKMPSDPIFAPLASAYPLLQTGKPLRGGDFADALCRPISLVPLAALTHRAIVSVNQTAVVTLTIAPDKSSSHPATEPLILEVLEPDDADNPVAGPSSPVPDLAGKPAKAAINLSVAQRTDTDGMPTSSSVKMELAPGNYLAQVGYGYCTGYFTVTLDSMKPLPEVKSNSAKSKIVTALRIKPGKLTLRKGQKARPAVTIQPAKAVGASLTWKSSNKKVAQVSSTGLIKAIRPGKAVITARTKNGKVAKTKIHVSRS
ncbi:MAG: Ig-like domain-containing protein [Bifidobacteriaceae bacterium]|jgi:hypothetical protein|nr:Ig-like domain-containing protein [Bifidobacteriaceae bacterium]